jgi:hypothetical protein
MPPFSWPRAGDLRQAGPYRLTGRVAGQPGTSSGSAGRYHGQAPDGTPVIVTVLSPAGPPDPAAPERLAAGALAAQQLAPFCVARILDAGAEAGDEYLVTEYVPGPPSVPPAALAGSWSGPVQQTHPALSVTVLISLPSGLRPAPSPTRHCTARAAWPSSRPGPAS